MKKNAAALLILAALMLGTDILSASDKKDWVARIDGETITAEDLNDYFYAYHSAVYNVPFAEVDKLAADAVQAARNPLLKKKTFLEELIKQKLLYKKALAEGIQNNRDAKILMKISEEQTILQFYLRGRFRKEISVTDAEIEAYYLANKEKMGTMPLASVRDMLKRQIYQKKSQEKILSIMEELRKEYKVEKNEASVK